MDKVFIEGLEVETIIGAYPWERSIRQCLRLDLWMGWDVRSPANQDELALALDYATVCQRVQTFAGEAEFILVETWIRLKVCKPGAVPAATTVGVEIERGCR